METELKNSEKNIAENKEELGKIQEKFTKEFENLANKILEEKSTKFTEQNKVNMTSILSPLKEKIEGFEKKVSESQKESIGMHSALKEQLNNLKDLNLQMSKEAINLTKALKGDSKAQGDWGETQLEILLEKANLAKNIHFTTQGGYRDDDGILWNSFGYNWGVDQPILSERDKSFIGLNRLIIRIVSLTDFSSSIDKIASSTISK